LVVRLWPAPAHRPVTSPYPGVRISSRNGSIYFRSQVRDGVPTDWVAISPRGTGRRTVFPASGSFVPDHLTFSPDGRMIAVDLVGRPGIWVADADGTHAVRLTRGANDAWPTWSPDGTRIAFAGSMASSPCPPVRFEYGCYRDLYVMNADGTGLHLVARDAIAPSWSPDGGRIAFETNSTGMASIQVVNANGTGEHFVASTAQGSDLAPAWSPDGRSIVYASIRREDWGIFAVQAAGGAERVLVSVGSPLGYVDNPTWSPDGKFIAFVAGSGIDVMRPDGSHITSLVRQRTRYPAGAIAWQPVLAAQPTLSPSESVSPSAPVRLSVTGTLKLPSTPFGVTLDQGSLWIASYGRVLRVDPQRMLVTQTIRVPHLDEGSIASGTDVWVTVGSLHQVVRLDPATGLVTGRVHLDGYPGQVAAWGHDVWVVSATSGNGLLFHIDGSTGRVTSRTRLTASPNLGIVAAPGSVWISQPGGLLRVSADGSASTLSGVGFGPFTWPLAYGAGSLWASDGSDVFRIDPANGNVLAQIRVGAIRFAFADGKLWALTDTGSKSRTIYIPNPKHPSTVLYIDPNTNRIAGLKVAVGLVPMWMTAGEGSAWVVEFDTGRIERVSSSVRAA
jgi:WD40-like Beta Propeller Repeat